MIKDIYVTSDIWLASWLDTQGVSIVAVDHDGRGFKVQFRFSNAGDRAWQLAADYRAGYAQVNIRQFSQSHRYMIMMADRARRGYNPGGTGGSERTNDFYMER